ncbi:hypothetical protein LINGRAHAP2_LOCUS10540 [Linum grandiflorum]
MASVGASSSASGGCKTVYCNHNRACVVNISGTGKNPGRKFYCCPDWKNRQTRCDFFEWVDGPREGVEAADIAPAIYSKNEGLRVKLGGLEQKLATMTEKADRRKRENKALLHKLDDTRDNCIGVLHRSKRIEKDLTVLRREVRFISLVVVIVLILVLLKL